MDLVVGEVTVDVAAPLRAGHEEDMRLMLSQPEPEFAPGGFGTMLYRMVDRIAGAVAVTEARAVKLEHGAHRMP